MKKILFIVLVFSGLLVFGFAANIMASSAVEGDAPAIMASPQMVVLAKVSDLTVHTNIPASAVDFGTVELNGVAPTGLWVDNCGHLVARFALADLGMEPGEVTVTLTGLFEDGTAFAATDMIRVK